MQKLREAMTMRENDHLTRIAASAKEMLTPADVAPVLGCNPYAINVTVKTNPAQLGFPVCVIGNRVKIPRRAFLRWAGYLEAQAEGPGSEGMTNGGGQ